MNLSGYSLVNLNDSTEINKWASIPDKIDLPNGDFVFCPELNGIYSNYKLIERYEDGEAPSVWYNKTSETTSLTDDKFIVTSIFTIVDLNVRKAKVCDQIMIKRDVVIDGGCLINGVTIQTRPDDRENVAGASQLATIFIMNGGTPTSLRWADANTDFQWIAADNSLISMSALDVINMGKSIAMFKTACIFYAKGLKDAVTNATTHESLDAIDINSGWPSN